MYSGYGITFDSADSWSCDNQTAWNVLVFSFDNGSASHAANGKINRSFGSAEKKFSKANTNSCLSLHYKADNTYWFFNGR